MSSAQMRDIERLEEVIDSMVGMGPHELPSHHKAKVPPPEKYKGEGDPEVLENWVYTLSSNLRANRTFGRALDGDRVFIIENYLEEQAFKAFKDMAQAAMSKNTDREDTEGEDVENEESEYDEGMLYGERIMTQEEEAQLLS